MDMIWCMSKKVNKDIKNIVKKVDFPTTVKEAEWPDERICTFCGKIEKNQKIEWARSVFTGKWVCMKCFNEKIRNG